MKKYIKKHVTEQELTSIICDKCNKEVKEYSLEDEVVSFRHTFGYGTELDGTEISFDICKSCLMDLIKDIKYRKKEMY